MNITRKIALLGLAALLSLTPGCATSAYQDIAVKTEAESKTNFDGYHSYMWVLAAGALRDPEGAWTPPDVDISAEIKFLVDREMRDRDLAEVANTPDLLVLIGIGVDMLNMAQVVDEEDGTMSLENVPAGAVVVVMTDPESRKVVWVGTAQSEIPEGLSTEDRRKRLDWAISEMFRQSPF